MMDRPIDLLRYLPQYLKEYAELYNIMITENPEFKLIANNTKRVLNNTFILYCDKNGIERFEKLLNIVASDDDTLESRKSKVLIAWNDKIPYTIKALMNKLIAVQGDDNIQIILDEYTITIITHMDRRGQTDSLWNLFEMMIPCNMQIVHKNIVECKTGGTVYVAAGTSFSKASVNEYTQWFGVNGNIYVGSGLNCGRVVVNEFTQYFSSSGNAYFAAGTSEVRMMVNNYIQNFSAKGNANVGVGVSNTEIIKIY